MAPARHPPTHCPLLSQSQLEQAAPEFAQALSARLRRLKVLRAGGRAIAPSMAGGPSKPPFEGVELARAVLASSRTLRVDRGSIS